MLIDDTLVPSLYLLLCLMDTYYPMVVLLQVVLGQVLYLLLDEPGEVLLLFHMILLELLVLPEDTPEHTLSPIIQYII